ncbi:SagB/ThcOx family dehydrogenase [Macrococcus capreoli]|uniref:SagB/ThcOx family dehydrogenase n=1 Tax=Macrococcus capreoli TaxID=2982690 RepID=UPI0021D5A2E3|nr:SagB/ThcOx family dehydrogenase [Macrococcus sp. TMW 2.2395]MCU7558625.1 SagB/ThcOx family dehydrogenase [Macrococcus sp. TMW 2.2395]
MKDYIKNLHKELEKIDLELIMSAKNKKAPKTIKIYNEDYKRYNLKINKNFDSKKNIFDLLNIRTSVRDYREDYISFENFSTLLHYSYGIKNYRSNAYNNNLYPVSFSPSAGGLNPFNIYIYIKRVQGIDPGLYYYSPSEEAIVQIFKGAVELDLVNNYTTEFPVYAAFNLFIIADINRFVWKYGNRGYRMVNIDAGILSENITLIATALGLGSCMIAAFSNDIVSENMNLMDDELPILGISVGVPNE